MRRRHPRPKRAASEPEWVGMRFVPHRPHRQIAYAAGCVAVAAVSITVALLVTPMQPVSLAGQNLRVGAAAPSFSLSGPGELDLFGQRLPTKIAFAGPVRPRLELTQLTLGAQLGSFFAQRHDGAQQAIGRALAAGWTRYFLWEIGFTAGCALFLSGALAGWARLGWRGTVVLVAAGLVLTEAINVGGIMFTAYTAPGRLRQVRSLTALAGRSELPPVPRATGRTDPGTTTVVLGDSTAAGLGNPPPAHPTRLDQACGRSADTYAADLAAINTWQVENLACSGATIRAGLLGSQPLGGVTAPPQLAVARKAIHASIVIVSVGADDLHWSALLRLCVVTTTCDSKASVAYFQQRLAAFTVSYYQLLKQLATLPSHPVVLINLYYNPFDPSQHCLDKVGLTPAKERSLGRLLSALNSVLAAGARASAMTPVTPDFTGHALCDPEPYVQGLHASAPFHPNPAGQLAIALADQHALTTYHR